LADPCFHLSGFVFFLAHYINLAGRTVDQNREGGGGGDFLLLYFLGNCVLCKGGMATLATGEGNGGGGTFLDRTTRPRPRPAPGGPPSYDVAVGAVAPPYGVVVAADDVSAARRLFAEATGVVLEAYTDVPFSIFAGSGGAMAPPVDRTAMKLWLLMTRGEDTYAELVAEGRGSVCLLGNPGADATQWTLGEAVLELQAAKCFGVGFDGSLSGVNLSLHLQTAEKCPKYTINFWRSVGTAGGMCVVLDNDVLHVNTPHKLAEALGDERCRYVTVKARVLSSINPETCKLRGVGHEIVLVWDTDERDCMIADSNGFMPKFFTAVLVAGIIKTFHALGLNYRRRHASRPVGARHVGGKNRWTVSKLETYACQRRLIRGGLAGSCQIWSQIAWQLFAFLDNGAARKTLSTLTHNQATAEHAVRSYVNAKIGDILKKRTNYRLGLYTGRAVGPGVGWVPEIPGVFATGEHGIVHRPSELVFSVASAAEGSVSVVIRAKNSADRRVYSTEWWKMALRARTIVSVASEASGRLGDRETQLLAAGIVLSVYIYGTLLMVSRENLLSARLRVSFV